jgi:hypothetical protein
VNPKSALSRFAFITTGLALTLFAARSGAVGTRRFVLDSGDDFSGGDLKGVAVDSVGRVRAGFDLGSIPISQGTSIWSILPMPDGSLLVGTGDEGKLLSVKGARVTVVGSSKELVITSLAHAWGSSVVLGTLPDGKVMKYEGGKLTTLVQLKGAEHVWQVAFDKKTGSVFAATGPNGKLFRIDRNGHAEVYFDAAEQHLMSVAVAPDGTVYAGSSDKAKLYKITGPGRASVLYDFERTEVRAIAVGKKGEVYAIANEMPSGSYVPSRNGRGLTMEAGPTSPPPKTKGKGTLYEFAPDGTPDQLIDNKDEHFTSLAIGDDGRPYVGTGVEGRVYTVDDAHNSVLVADTEERQVTALLLQGKQHYVASSDPAVLHPIRGIGGPDAVWTSKVLDAGIRAHFGRLSWLSTGAIEFSTRSGNTKDPDKTWSAWSRPLTVPGVIASPPGRYFQVRARFDRDKHAVLSELDVPFVTDNLRAIVTDIDVSSSTHKKHTSSSSLSGVHKSGGPITKTPDTKLTVTWKVDNPDKDALRYVLKYRLVGTRAWYNMEKPKELLTKPTYTWDTADLPEGRYRVRVIASDDISNPPDRAKRHQLDSDVVLVDNTPPIIEDLRVRGRHISGVAVDGVGPIKRIEISVAGSDRWHPFYPVDGVFDQAREKFDADVSSFVPKGSHIVSVRVYDKANNFVVRDVTVR